MPLWLLFLSCSIAFMWAVLQMFWRFLLSQ